MKKRRGRKGGEGGAAIAWITETKFYKFWIFGIHGKIICNDMKGGREVLFPANPDLADILGDMDLDFENFHFFLDSKFMDFQVSSFS